MAEIYANYIGSEWVTSQHGIADISPSDTTDTVGVFAAAGVDDARAAVASAQQAQANWAATSGESRAELLEATARYLIERAEDLGRLLAREEGKTLGEAIAEVRRSAQVFRFCSGEPPRNSGDRRRSPRHGIEVEYCASP